MTHILALDSSTDACSVALYRDGEVTSQFELAIKSHTQRLLPMVDELLRGAGCKPRDLDAIAFGRGPGSFTGLRICMGVVQGLAFGAQLPVIPVSTLAAMAAAYFRENNTAVTPPALVALDARMEEIYWALFAKNENLAEPELLTVERVATPASVADDTAVLALDRNFVGVGPGWHYPDLQSLSPAQVHQHVYPQAEDIARIAAEKFARGESVPIMEAELVYLRDNVSWQKRQRIRSVTEEKFL
jgi:tRNA threonylcarbamoyladenosine biosynthesis protein TsaB